MSQNPYWGNDFFQFFVTLTSRLYQLTLHGSAEMHLASDELQMLVLILISFTGAMIGTFLVLRKMTMLANALSHTILPGVVLAYLAYQLFLKPQANVDFSHLLPSDALLLASALLSALLTTFLTQTLVSHLQLAEDASIGMVFTFLFAIGIILVTVLTRSVHIGAELLMGNVDALHYEDLVLMFWIFVGNSLVLLILWRPFFLTTFDPLYAKMCGISNTKMSYLLMAQVAVCAIGAFRAVGVLLFLAFLVTAPLIARRFTHKLSYMTALACLAALSASVIGVALSRHLLSIYDIACSTSGLIVTILALSLGLALISRPRA